MYTLYHSPGTCSLAIKAALHMTGAQHQVHQINLAEGEHQTEDYLAINPLGKVPALDTGHTVLTEGFAIQLYLAEQYPAAGILPTDNLERQEAFRWMAFLYTNLHPHFSRLFSPSRFGSDTDDIQKNAEREVFALLSLVNDRLGSHPFLAGEQLSAADLYLVVALHWTSVLRSRPTDEYGNLAPFINRLLEHPVVGQVLRSELAG